MKNQIIFSMLFVVALLLAGCQKNAESSEQKITGCSLSLCDCKCYPSGETPEEKTGMVCGIWCLKEYGVSGCELIEGQCVEIIENQDIQCETDEDCIPEEPLVGVQYICGENNICETKPLGNPAATKCVEDGGTLEPVTNWEGEDAICIFDDGSMCPQWDYFNGECNPGDCFKECKSQGTRSEGWYNSCTGELIEWANCS